MAQILILDDDPDIRMLLEMLTQDMGHTPLSIDNLEEGLQSARANSYNVILLDLDFPEGNGIDILPELTGLPYSPEVIIITGTGDTKGAEIAFQYGAWDYVQKPFLVKDVTLVITRALQYHQGKALVKPPAVLKKENIVGESSAILKCLDEVAKAAVTDSSVLIWGETGSGKELFAKAIHKNSPRADKNFVVIDCGALPETLVESLLFGHEKGAFTGATHAKKGLITHAEGGTLFLDEIGELPLTLQKKLLRTLQEHRVRPVGAKKEIRVDFRLVAATNQNLEAMIDQKKFRSDLLFRIRGIEIELPPLRARIEDIQDIAYHKIKQLGKLYGLGTKNFSAEFIEILEKYDWPGNVRELINVLEHSLANALSDPFLVPKHLPPKYRASLLYRISEEEALVADDDFKKWNEYKFHAEKKYLLTLVRKSQGRWDDACQLSGLSKTRLYELLKKHDLSFSDA